MKYGSTLSVTHIKHITCDACGYSKYIDSAEPSPTVCPACQGEGGRVYSSKSKGYAHHRMASPEPTWTFRGESVSYN